MCQPRSDDGPTQQALAIAAKFAEDLAALGPLPERPRSLRDDLWSLLQSIEWHRDRLIQERAAPGWDRPPVANYLIGEARKVAARHRLNLGQVPPDLHREEECLEQPQLDRLHALHYWCRYRLACLLLGKEGMAELRQQHGGPALLDLGGPRDRPRLRLPDGTVRDKPPLKPSAYRAVRALMEAEGHALVKDQLDARSGVCDARVTLQRLAKRDADWAAVLAFPGHDGQGDGYRLRVAG